MIEPIPKKSLGQHWLHDDASLQAMCDAVGLTRQDTVLEVGPGLGTLTTKLVAQSERVVAVEFDHELARDLPKRVKADNLRVMNQDILRLDLRVVPEGYVVVANIPYYLTSNLLRILCESPIHFSRAALLVQKEVAQRVCAAPGQMSLLSVSVQFYCDAQLDRPVPKALFTPPPKVDSQILKLTYRAEPLFPAVDTKKFFRVVKAGFAQRRKTLLNSLGAGLQLSREETTVLLEKANISPQVRAQNLSLQQWYELYKIVE